MRYQLWLAAFVAAVTAAPHAQVETALPPISVSESFATPTITVIPTTSLNIPVTFPTLLPTTVPGLNFSSTSRTRRRPSHWEPVPIFSRSCDCPKLATVRYPCWATDALEKCNFEENHSWVCWTSANYGCPSPTRACSDLFSPTPVTGKHPCELGPGVRPEPTEAPILRF